MAESPLATLRVPRDHPIFSGHFPGMPLVPGVMLLEWAVREAARALSIDTRDLRIRESKFVAALRPGEQAELFLTSASPRHVFKVYRAAELLASGTLEQK